MSRVPDYLRRPVGRPRNPEPITLQVQLGPDAIRALSEAVRLTADDIEQIAVAVAASLQAALTTRVPAEPPHPNQMRRANEVAAFCAMSRSAMWRRIRDGIFPQGFRIGVTTRGWFEHELNTWNAAVARSATDDELRELSRAIVASRANVGEPGWPPVFKLPERSPVAPQAKAKRPRGRPRKAV